MKMKLGFVALAATMLGLAVSAFAGKDDGVLFDARTGGGVYYSKSGGKSSTNGMVDVSGVLVIGNENGSNVQVDMALLSTVGGTNGVAEADVALRGRWMGKGRFGFEASLPMKYRRDDKYFDLSAIEVDGVVRIVNKGGHQLNAKAGIAFGKRYYKNNLEGYTTAYDPVAVGDGYFYAPSYAHIEGAPWYQHDPYADGTYADNRDVYFGGGTMTRTVNTSFETSESTVRFPVAIEYKYNSKNDKLTIKATAYYTLRAGSDALKQHDDTTDHYQGYLSYSNVYWQTCVDEHDPSNPNDDDYYQCDPYNIQYGGQGHVTTSRRDTTTLDSKGFVGHTLGGKGEITYSVYKRKSLEVLLNGQFRAEFDSHVMDGDTGEVRNSKRLIGTAGAIVRF